MPVFFKRLLCRLRGSIHLDNENQKKVVVIIVSDIKECPIIDNP